ncbi:MAG: helix-turn-helix transcriptional regulator [Pseudomonadota bacterium]
MSPNTSSSPTLRPRDAARYLGISRGSLYTLRNDPDFPPAISLGRRAIGFLRTDLDAYLARRRQGARS